MVQLWWILLLPILDLLFLARIRAFLGTPSFLLWLGASALLGILAIRTGGFRSGPGGQLPPEGRFLDRALVVLGGLLLVFPGPASDVLGLLLLIPRVRRKVLGWLLGSLLGRRIESLERRWSRVWRSDPTPPPRSEGGDWTRKTGRTLGRYPGAEGARDVEFQEANRVRSESLKNNKG